MSFHYFGVIHVTGIGITFISVTLCNMFKIIAGFFYIIRLLYARVGI